MIVVVGGNRSGKSKVGEGIISRVVRREGPIYQRLRNPAGRPLKVWVAPETDEKAQSLWEPRLLEMMAGMDFRYVSSPHRVITWKDGQGGGELWLKSQEQGFKSFESDDVDLCLFDEEPEDRRVVASARTRMATTNGVVVFTYTPLKGMTWTYEELYAPVAEQGTNLIAERVWRKGNSVTVVQMGMADNPEAVAGGGVKRILEDTSMTPAEKDARLLGKYGFTEGLLVPQFAALKLDRPSPMILDRLPADRPYRWFLLADPNKSHGALLVAQDHEDNRFYCAEHFAVGLPDSEHAKAYTAMLREFKLRPEEVEVYADPGGAGKQAIINLAEVGYFASPVPKDPGSVAASIKRLRRAAHSDPDHRHPVTGAKGAPHVYFLRTLNSQWREGGVEYNESRLLWEFRQYRQKEGAAPDTPIKKKDDVVDCARYFELVHADAPDRFDFDPNAAQRAKLDQLSRKEAEEFDRLLEKLATSSPYARSA